MSAIKIEQEKILWSDRKRILRLPITFTKYFLSVSRFTTRRGLFNTKEEEILLYRILDISLSRNFIQKIFGMGTITLFTADRSTAQTQLVNIINPERTKLLFSKLIEEERLRKGHLAKEMYGSGFTSTDAQGNYIDVDQDGIPDFIDNDIQR